MHKAVRIKDKKKMATTNLKRGGRVRPMECAALTKVVSSIHKTMMKMLAGKRAGHGGEE